MYRHRQTTHQRWHRLSTLAYSICLNYTKKPPYPARGAQLERKPHDNAASQQCPKHQRPNVALVPTVLPEMANGKSVQVGAFRKAALRVYNFRVLVKERRPVSPRALGPERERSRQQPHWHSLVRHEKNTKGRRFTRRRTPCSCLLVKKYSEPPGIVDGSVVRGAH